MAKGELKASDLKLHMAELKCKKCGHTITSPYPQNRGCGCGCYAPAIIVFIIVIFLFIRSDVDAGFFQIFDVANFLAIVAMFISFVAFLFLKQLIFWSFSLFIPCPKCGSNKWDVPFV